MSRYAPSEELRMVGGWDHWSKIFTVTTIGAPGVRHRLGHCQLTDLNLEISVWLNNTLVCQQKILDHETVSPTGKHPGFLVCLLRVRV